MGSDSHTHTQGPWVYSQRPLDDWGWVTTKDGAFICQAKDPRVSHDDLKKHRVEKTDPWEANARLIAAAPCMKEALEKLQAFFDAVTGHCFGGACAFEYGSDLDYGEFLDLAEKAGLLRTEEYDPDKHGSGADCAPGDTWYVPTNIGRDALSRATKGGENDEG